MINPWKCCDLDAYESHMALENVGQLQLLNKIMKSQLFDYSVDTVAIWGIAGGNGLNHVSSSDFLKIYGIDINEDYLNHVSGKYSNLEKILSLECIDLNDLSINLNEVELVIANLIIEYIGIRNFTKQIMKSNPLYMSVVIQKNNSSNDFVSDSPYAEKLECLGNYGVHVNEVDLVESLKEINYENLFIKKYGLPNFKEFIRLDFIKK